MDMERLKNALPNRRGIVFGLFALAALAIPMGYTAAQNSRTARSDRWIHVRVVNKDAKGEVVRVNVPLEMAEKVLPAISHKNFHNGRVRFGNRHFNDMDVRALLDAVSTSRDGEFVTVQSKENDVRVAKQAGYLLVHVKEHGSESAHRVEVRMPLSVVNALLSGSTEELDLVAGIRALAGQPDMELVTVQDNQNTVRIWLDSKNLAN